MRFISQAKSSARGNGFTLVEMLVIAPLVILIIGAFVGVMMTMVNDVLLTHNKNLMVYDTQTALNVVEQDTFLSTQFYSTSGDLPSPQGHDNNFAGTSEFTSANALIMSTFATDKNPDDPDRQLIYYANQPNPCGPSQNVNRVFLTKVIYFVKDGSLWRRVIVPEWNQNGSVDEHTVCNTPWQRNSCTPSVVSSNSSQCQTSDTELVQNVESFVVSYYRTSSSTEELNANEADEASTIRVSITTKDSVSGESASYSTSMRATKFNSTISDDDFVAPPAPMPTWTPCSLKNGWVNYGAGFAPANYIKTNASTVVLKGLIRAGTASTGTVLCTLPAELRPNYRLIFHTSAVNSTARIDIDTSGNVIFMYGASAWISLDGIVYQTADSPNSWINLSTLNGWHNYGSGYAAIQTKKDSFGRVYLQGLGRAGSWGNTTPVSQLPPGYRPGEYTHTPSYASGFNGISIDANGNIMPKMTGGSYLPTQTMFYPAGTTGWNNLSLKNGWSHYTNSTGNTYSTPQYKKAPDEIVSVKGLITGGTSSYATVIATLPPGYRPSEQLIFDVVVKGSPVKYGRIDIMPNGDITIRSTDTTSGYLSLDSINFIAEQ